MDATIEMQIFLRRMVEALVDNTAAIVIATDQDTNGSTMFRVHAAPEDIGKLIGKQGRTARSLRTLLGAASMKFQRRYALDIVETGRVPA